MRPVTAFLCICLLILLWPILPLCAAQPAGKSKMGATRVYTGWTPNAFLIAFDVTDSDITGDPQNLREPWRDDAITAYLCFDGMHPDRLSDKCLRVVISAAGGLAVQRGAPTGWRDDPAWLDLASTRGTIRCGVSLRGQSTLNDHGKRDEGYRVEIGLPWPLIGVSPPDTTGGAPPATIGLAAVRYSQGEARAISCWPAHLTSADLDMPARWLSVPLLLTPAESAARTLGAPRLDTEPVVDGTFSRDEWARAGTVSFTEGQTVQPSPTPPLRSRRQQVSIIAAWYVLDPVDVDAAHQPLDPPGPWGGPEHPLSHQVQLQDARRAGLDALAVALPADPRLTGATRIRLAALASALRDQTAAAVEMPELAPPLLLPIIDLTTAEASILDGEAGEKIVAALLADFYRLIPPQQRLLLPDATGRYRCPVIMSSPPELEHADASFIARIGSRIQETCSVTPGWIIDSAWPEAGKLPELLGRCALAPPTGCDLGSGPVQTAVILPGWRDDGREVLPRAGGRAMRSTGRRFRQPIPTWCSFAAGMSTVMAVKSPPRAATATATSRALTERFST